MEFPLFNPQHKQVEEEALFRFSSMISLEKAGVAGGSESDVFKKIVEPLLTGDSTHRSITDNRIAFALLGSLLNPAGGPGRHLPQQSPHWLAFRRLFLAICDQPIPKDILNLGIWEKQNQNAHQAQVAQLENGWIVGEGWMDCLRSFLRTCHELLDASSRQHHDQMADSEEHGIPPDREHLETEHKWTAYLRLLAEICDRLIDKVVHEEIESVDSRTPVYSGNSERSSEASRAAVVTLLEDERRNHREDWTSLFRLYLEICDETVPAKLWKSNIWDKTNEKLTRAAEALLLQEPIIDRSSLAEREHPWEKEFLPQLPIIKHVTAERLSGYSNLTLSSVKRHFIEHATVSLEAECGALYEVLQAIDWDSVPLSDRIENSEESTQGWLRQIMAEEKPDFDFDQEYTLAVQSVRGVLFDLAVESILGKAEPDNLSAWECELKFFENRLLKNPYSILNDDRILFFLADGLGHQGESFAKHLASRLMTLRSPEANRDSQQAAHRLKQTLARHWLDPDLPLWLMQAPVVQEIIKPRLPSTHRCTIGQIKEVTKNRSSSTKTGLHVASKTPIIPRNPGKAEFGVAPIWLWKYIQHSRHSEGFRKHLEKVASEKLTLNDR